nr:PREDICTED: BTB/POZ domain-containing protein 1-like [Bemisia tabaci]XP_018900418.1 PREDICTED: BTB/POZ domain-containing protein 1-like [Bemisia tabaci]XP_018900419.1 PREDICTED: BTB/POZ domain-containing protein 1-like [Bemisia tabaci]XP_018900420.1 PREDICTED: BTB/POZ domain-containing protein 1-like [Bemisia tabaci]
MSSTNPKTDWKTRGAVSNNDEDWRVTSLSDRQEIALRENLFTDVCFIVGTEEKRIPAIRSILSLGSSVFAAMLSERWSSDESEIAVPDVEPDAFYELLRFIYCEKVALTKLIVWPLFYAADKYDVQALKLKCITFLKTSLTPSDLCYYLLEARLLGATDVMNLCFERLSTAATSAIFHCPRDDEVNFCFHDLDVETICCILERNKLEIEEVDLFKSILGWAKLECRRQNLKTNVKNMRRVLEPVLPLIRFRLMSLKEFTEVVSNSGILSIEEELSILTYLISRPRPENLRPIPRFQKSIKILICDEKSRENYNVQVNCSDTVAELRKKLKDRAVPRDDVARHGTSSHERPPRGERRCGPQYYEDDTRCRRPYFCPAPIRVVATTDTGGIADTDILKHENVCLENSRPLSDYGIGNESIILLQSAQSQQIRQIIREARPGALQNEANKLTPCNKI